MWRRSNEEAANPRGGSSPYVSSAGHNILDIKFCKITPKRWPKHMSSLAKAEHLMCAALMPVAIMVFMACFSRVSLPQCIQNNHTASSSGRSKHSCTQFLLQGKVLSDTGPSFPSAVSSLKLYGKGVEYRKIADEIMGVKGVITHGLILDTANAAVIADGPEAKIIEKVF